MTQLTGNNLFKKNLRKWFKQNQHAKGLHGHPVVRRRVVARVSGPRGTGTDAKGAVRVVFDRFVAQHEPNVVPRVGADSAGVLLAGTWDDAVRHCVVHGLEWPAVVRSGILRSQCRCRSHLERAGSGQPC